jgi:TRAP-type C4-dicarboxylate transport system substrate-binding protein
MSTDAFNALSPDLQQAVSKAGAEASAYQRKYAADVANTFLDDIKKNGMEVEENVDLESFRKKAQSVYGEIAGEIGQDLIDSVVNTK